MAIALRRPLGDLRASRSRRRPAAAMAALVLTVARLIRLAAMIAVLIIVAAIILRVAGANGANGIVHALRTAGRWLVGPFATMFTERNPKVAIALNWGLAAVVYAVAGALLAGFVARLAPRH